MKKWIRRWLTPREQYIVLSLCLMFLAGLLFRFLGLTDTTTTSTLSVPVGKMDGLIDINQADSLVLTTLPGIGPDEAARILELRRRKGGYSRIAELKEVRGVNDATLEALMPRLKVGSYEKK